MNMFLSQAAPELDLLGPQQRKYMHEQCHGGREGVTGIIFSTFLGASWGIIFIGIGPCWGRNLQKHHVEQTGVALSTAVARRRREKCKPATYFAGVSGPCSSHSLQARFGEDLRSANLESRLRNPWPAS